MKKFLTRQETAYLAVTYSLFPIMGIAICCSLGAIPTVLVGLFFASTLPVSLLLVPPLFRDVPLIISILWIILLTLAPLLNLFLWRKCFQRKQKDEHLTKNTKITLIVLTALYVSTYIFLSLQGRYEPSCIGASGVKSYRWAPLGFVSDMKWRNSLFFFFLPIYVADNKLWHTFDESYSGKYPITEVAPDEVWKYYTAWGELEQPDGAVTQESAPSAAP